MFPWKLLETRVAYTFWNSKTPGEKSLTTFNVP